MTYYNIEIAFSKRKRSLEAAHSDDICYVLAERLFYIQTRDTSPSKKIHKKSSVSLVFRNPFFSNIGLKKSRIGSIFFSVAASIFYKLTDEIFRFNFVPEKFVRIFKNETSVTSARKALKFHAY